MRKTTKGFLMLLTTAALLSGVAYAGEGHGRGHHKKEMHTVTVEESVSTHTPLHEIGVAVPSVVTTTKVVTIDDSDKTVIRRYYTDHRDSWCPPGLAKKGGDCLPPGHKRTYVVGSVLPSDVTYYPLPDDVVVQLRPVPQGYRYVRVDGDVLLMADASKEIIDAFTLMSAVGN